MQNSADDLPAPWRARKAEAPISDDPSKLTGLLRQWSEGDRSVLDRLVPLVHRELHQIAGRLMRQERPGHSLQATALVNEAFLRLIDANGIRWEDRAHFFARSAGIMRRILVDHARARGAEKRGGGAATLTFDEMLDGCNEPAEGFVALDDALGALAKFAPRQSRVIELRFFGGLTVEETATVLKVSPETVMRDWRLARAWLKREMRAAGPPEP